MMIIFIRKYFFIKHKIFNWQGELGKITYPEKDGDNDVGAGTEVSADGDSQVPGEEGQPTQQEASHHNS